MSTSRAARKKHTAARAWLATVFASVALLFLAPSLCDAAAREKMSLRFLRGVHVLRDMAPGEHWPAVTVPRQVRTHDTTSALMAHPDRTVVLDSISHDLAAATKTGAWPEAGYYAAHAFSLQGKHAEAAAAMKSYLAKAPFRDEDYLFLVKSLYTSADYKAAFAATREWQVNDDNQDACSEDRLVYAWGSLQARGRYREAMEEVLSDPCASWRGQLLFARSSLGLGDADEAEARLENVLAAYPDKELPIRLLWDRLTTTQRYP